MTRVIVNRFNRGLTSQKYPAGSGYAADMTHCDISTDETLIKMPKRFIADSPAQNFVIDAVLDVDKTVVGIGSTSTASSRPTIYRKTFAAGIGSAWATMTTCTGNGQAYYNSLFLYNGEACAVSKANGSGAVPHYIDKFVAGTLTNVASFTVASTLSSDRYIPKPVVHPLDKKVYVAIMKTVYVWDGSSSSLTTGITTPDTIINIEQYGSYLAISCIDGNGKSVVYFWGRDTTLTTFQDMIEIADENIIALKNMGGKLIAITSSSSQTYTTTYKVKARQVTSAGSSLLAEAYSTSGNSDTTFDSALSNFTSRGKLYFLDNGTSNIWAFGFNRNGEPYLSKERYGILENQTNAKAYAAFAVSDYFFVNCDRTGASSTEKPQLNITDTLGAAGAYTLETVYTFPPNEMIQSSDIGKIKRLNQAYVKAAAYTVDNGSIKLEVRYDEGSWSTVFQENADTTRKIFVIEASADLNGDAFNEGRDIQFRVTSDVGVDIAELGYDYETVSTTI